jgi:hypothetical protein
MNETPKLLQVYMSRTRRSPSGSRFCDHGGGAELDGCSDDAQAAIADVFALQLIWF